MKPGITGENFDSFLNTDPITSTSTLTTTFTATDNRAVTPADYNPYSVPVPVDPRLPRSGGYVIGGLYDISPAAFGKTDNFISRATNYGSPKNYWHGVDMQVNARLSGGLTLQGGTSTGRVVNDTCDLVIDNPSQYNCHKAFPFQTEIRGLAIYTVPKINVQVERHVAEPSGRRDHGALERAGQRHRPVARACACRKRRQRANQHPQCGRALWRPA